MALVPANDTDNQTIITMITLLITQTDDSDQQKVIKRAKVANDKIASEVVRDMLGSEYVTGTVELPIPVPERFNNVIGNYVNFLHGKATEITTNKKLLQCFLMNMFFSDPNYFSFLIQQLLLHWSGNAVATVLPNKAKMSGDVAVVESLSALPDMLVTQSTETNGYLDLVREIELHLPFHLVSDYYKTLPSFVKEWLTVTDNHHVTINGNEEVNCTFDENTKDTRAMITVSTDGIAVFDPIRNKTAATVVAPEPAHHSLVVSFTINDKVDPLRILYQFDSHYRLQSEIPMIANDNTNFVVDGTARRWHSNAQPAVEQEYVNGKAHGKITEFFDNGDLAVEGRYKKGYRDGIWTLYDWDTRTTYRYIHDNGELVALKRFTMGGQLVEGGKFGADRMARGEWSLYDASTHTIESGVMFQDIQVGTWITTDAETGQELDRNYYPEPDDSQDSDYDSNDDSDDDD